MFDAQGGSALTEQMSAPTIKQVVQPCNTLSTLNFRNMLSGSTTVVGSTEAAGQPSKVLRTVENSIHGRMYTFAIL